MERWHHLDGIQGQMEMLAGQMMSLKSDVVHLSAQVQHHDQRMSDFERQLKDVTAGRSTGSGAASSPASSEPHPDPATERDVICEKLREIFGQELGVKDW